MFCVLLLKEPMSRFKSKSLSYEHKVSATSSSATTGDYIYYDVNIPNPPSATSDLDAKFISSPSTPILTETDEYAVSIIRFNIPSNSVPLIANALLQLKANVTSLSLPYQAIISNNPNVSSVKDLTVGMYIVGPGITKGTLVTSVFVNPDLQTAVIGLSAAPTSIGINYWTFYKYVISMKVGTNVYTQAVQISESFDQIITYVGFENLLSGINRGLQSVFLSTVSGESLSALAAPYFTLDASSGIFSLYADNEYFSDQYGVVPKILIYFNNALYNLFSGLSAVFMGYEPILTYELAIQTIGDSYSYNYVDVTPRLYYNNCQTTALSTTITLFNSTNNILPGYVISGTGIPSNTTISSQSGTYTYVISKLATATSTSVSLNIAPPPFVALKMTQITSSLWFWNPIRKIVITSGAIPTTKQVSANLITTSSSSVASGADIYQSIITDFEPQAGIDTFEPFQYSPTSNWRFVSLLKSSELKTIDLQFYWVDQNGNFNLFTIPPGQSLSALLCFARKEHVTL